jgi:hypothetical protein
VRTEEVLHRVKEERNILHTIKRRKVYWIGHILRRNCLLKCVIKGKIEVRIEVMEVDRTLYRNIFGRGYGPVVRLRSE